MHVSKAGIGVAAGLIVAMTPVAEARAQEREVSDIPYVTCDGSLWYARLSGETFLHTPERGVPHADTIIRYRTWGGQCWQAVWNNRRRAFFHTPVDGGAGHPDTILNFEDWEGVRWTARRDGNDWIVTRP